MNHRSFHAEFNNIATNFKEEEIVPAHRLIKAAPFLLFLSTHLMRSVLKMQINKQLTPQTSLSLAILTHIILKCLS